jgi:hypothetical protein
MTGEEAVMGKLLYGCGLRVLECMRLRVKDVDLSGGKVEVRAGKNDKDRVLAAAVDGDDFGAVQQAVEDGSGSGNVTQQLSPFVHRTVGGHDGGAHFVAAQDDFEQQFAAARGQGFESHVVDDEQVGFEIAGEQAVFRRASFAGDQIAHEVEDGAVIDGMAVADGFAPEGLGKVAFANSGRPH